MPNSVLKPKTENSPSRWLSRAGGRKLKTSSAELRAFIHNFDFTNSDHTDFPYSPSGPEALRAGGQSLSRYEQGILTGIRLAWYTTRAGKIYLRKKTIKAGGIAAVAIAVIVFAQLTITSPAVAVVKTVAAATVSAILR